jgi:hypothetical protein
MSELESVLETYGDAFDIVVWGGEILLVLSGVEEILLIFPSSQFQFCCWSLEALSSFDSDAL